MEIISNGMEYKKFWTFKLSFPNFEIDILALFVRLILILNSNDTEERGREN